MKVTTHLKRLVVAAAAAVLLFAGSFVPTAQADGFYLDPYINIRWGPATWYSVYGQGFPEQDATAWYILPGQNIEGYDYWAFHTNWTTGDYGWSTCRWVSC